MSRGKQKRRSLKATFYFVFGPTALVVGLGVNDHAPTNRALSRRMLVMVLRWKGNVRIVRNFFAAANAPVDAGVGCRVAGVVNRVERTMRGFRHYSRVLIKCQSILFLTT